jgi:rsbT co-antagonist protein RsbR
MDFEGTGKMDGSIVGRVLRERSDGLLDGWMEQLARVGIERAGMASETDLRQQCKELLDVLCRLAEDDIDQADLGASAEIRELLDEVSRSRVRLGVSPRENALFVFSLKRPLFRLLFEAAPDDADVLMDELWRATRIVDQLALMIVEAYQRSREAVISRQQEELLELSTPVVRLWDGIVAMPLIGTLDSGRTQVVMETLLEKIVEDDAGLAILDITGVSTVDTLVAQHLLKTVAAARLMGADCIISGIRPQIAQTIVQLGLDLSTVTTKATLADAFAFALERRRGTLGTGGDPGDEARGEER